MYASPLIAYRCVCLDEIYPKTSLSLHSYNIVESYDGFGENHRNISTHFLTLPCRNAILGDDGMYYVLYISISG